MGKLLENFLLRELSRRKKEEYDDVDDDENWYGAVTSGGGGGGRGEVCVALHILMSTYPCFSLQKGDSWTQREEEEEMEEKKSFLTGTLLSSHKNVPRHIL